MYINKLWLFLIAILLTLSIFALQAHASATQSENGITISTQDAREIIADNAALVAEVDAVNEALAAERKSTAEIIEELNKYTKASEEERDLLKEQNSLLQKNVKQEKRKGTLKMILGLAVGGIIGATTR